MKKLLKRKDVAKLLGKTEQTVTNYTNRKSDPLPAHYLTKNATYFEDEVLEWIERQPTNKKTA
ncbi:MAG: helix-turn-helix domain-containing protein [Coriobacteriia bacterium]|nr:helix-turn-helix domain-containing protein [Coriobacteriia bacterium]